MYVGVVGVVLFRRASDFPTLSFSTYDHLAISLFTVFCPSFILFRILSFIFFFLLLLFLLLDPSIASWFPYSFIFPLPIFAPFLLLPLLASFFFFFHHGVCANLVTWLAHFFLPFVIWKVWLRDEAGAWLEVVEVEERDGALQIEEGEEKKV